MQDNHPVVQRSETIVHATRQIIHDEFFGDRHRVHRKDFTRRRKLTFMNVVVLLLQKTVRSIQLHLHDFFAALDVGSAVGAPAWCEARMKLRYTAFIELNQRAILDVVYEPASPCGVRRWKGMRLIGIDSSLVRLPNEPEVGEHFGWVECSNQQGGAGRYPQARLSALTDVLNRIVLEARLVPWQQGERGLAMEQIRVLAPEDIGILDRGFAAYEMFARFVALERRFVCRCPASSFSVVTELFAQNQAGRSVVVTLRPGDPKKRAQIARLGLPDAIPLRFVTVRLASGELEVLATNLLDEERYPAGEFGELYNFRWGIETYYGLIKGRLDLENFTGRSVEAVRQDVYSTLFLSNLESVLIVPAQAELEDKSQSLRHCQRVNHAVSFHALKARMIELLLSQEPIPKVLNKLQSLFLDNPVCYRPQRKAPRLKQSAWRSYQYQRNTKKVVF